MCIRDRFNESRIISGDTNGATGWQSRFRQLPFPGTDLIDGDTRGVYAVEVYYTNAFVTPIGSFMTHFDQMGGTFIIPGQLYDAAFYGVITGTPTSQVTLPDPNKMCIRDRTSRALFATRGCPTVRASTSSFLRCRSTARRSPSVNSARAR